jgi:HEAT repeat protein
MRRATLGVLPTLLSILTIAGAGSMVEPHVRDLESDVASVREHAALALGRAGAHAAAPALVEALKDAAPAVRREAAKALGRIKDAKAVPALIDALGDTEQNVRFYAAYALGEIEDPRAAEALLRALHDPAWCVRDQAAWALREIASPEMVETLVAALKDPDADAAHVLWLLRHVGAERAAAPLAKLLGATEAETRLRAVRMLRKLGTKNIVEHLIAALKDADRRVRRTAIEALLEVGDDRAQAPLRALAAREKDAALRQAALTAARTLSRHKDLVAHWSFDDQDKTTAKDVSGRGPDGQIQGCTPVKGRVGHGLRFGEGACIELGKPASLQIAETPFTVAAWVKSDAPNGVVVARGGAWCGYSLYIKDGVAKFGIHRVKDGPGYIAAGEEKVVGSWVHLAGVVQQDRIELYVNGELAASAKTEGLLPSNCGQSMCIGFDTGNSAAEITDHFHGIIDEVKAYQAALSAEEIAKESRTAPPVAAQDHPEE